MNIIIIGKTLSGKSTLARKFRNIGYEYIVEYTTRPKRDGEIDDEDYHYIDQDKFIKLDKSGFFAERISFDTIYGKWWYGASKEDFMDDGNKVVVMGPLQFKQMLEANIPAFSVYLDVSDDEIYRRVEERQDSLDEVKRRLHNDNPYYEEIRDVVTYVVDGNQSEDKIFDDVFQAVSAYLS